ncbi:hypothetical protein FLM9_962 [Candidatus Synechococcus spongiarum]|uniref:OmpA-like domain-containing protein n=2 Tax=Candidatus Synechococcus spongiarum TaxID=431041 RepID=A0A171DGS4_9SYNE|nr:hypothetical protein FLM9_962 [Candidatus Synechococcus spongiarum]
MANARRTRGKDGDSSINPWLGYTDVLSSMLLIVVLAMGLVTLAKALNEKPPLISLTETDSEAFKFDTGSYGLSQGFLNALDERYTNDIKPTIEAFDVDVIEVIGHTDGQPNPRVASNLDRRLQTVTLQGGLTGLQYSSNAELGLLRAIAVGMYLQSRLEKDQLPVGIRPYSAASLLDLQGNFNPAPAVSDDRTRRRIDLRFTRSN